MADIVDFKGNPVEKKPEYRSYHVETVEGESKYPRGFLGVTPDFIAVYLEGGEIVFSMPLSYVKYVETLEA